MYTENLYRTEKAAPALTGVRQAHARTLRRERQAGLSSIKYAEGEARLVRTQVPLASLRALAQRLLHLGEQLLGESVVVLAEPQL